MSEFNPNKEIPLHTIDLVNMRNAQARAILTVLITEFGDPEATKHNHEVITDLLSAADDALNESDHAMKSL